MIFDTRTTRPGTADATAPASVPPPPAPVRPIPLTARQLNEFVYCPRLFYYETVEGLFVHNADTREGASVHQRVNQREDGLPASSSPRKKAKPRTTDQAATTAPADDNDATARTDDEASAAPETIHARSVSLHSARLDVTAKLDLAEARPAHGDLFSLEVTPVEYKKGHPREGEDGPVIWPADRMQLGLQMLLLRENGFQCTAGVLFYRETRQRLTLPWSDELGAWVEAQVHAARACAAGPIPAPLDDSPKCPRCSLVGICLPDETRLLARDAEPADDPHGRGHQLALPLADRLDEPAPERLAWGPFARLPEISLRPRKLKDDVRRLITPNPETKALYLHTPGHYVSKKGRELVVKEEGKAVASVRLHDLHHVALFGPVQISSGAIQTLCQEDIPMTWFTLGGWFYGMTRGHSLTNVFTRIEQFRAADQPDQALALARLFVYGKIRNQRTLLMRNHQDPPREALKLLKYLAGSALGAASLGTLLGLEGSAARVYFELFGGMLKTTADDPDQPDSTAAEAFPFYTGHRNRRPPRDPVNALLSLLYSLLAKDCTIACHAVGFDPYVGYLHQPRYGRPALALDLMEEFRPLVADSTALTLLNNRMLAAGDFLTAGDSVALTPGARKKVFLAYEKRLTDTLQHPVFNYRVSYRRALELQARLLAKTLTGEIEQYPPLTTR